MTNLRTSNLILEQVPEFIRDEYPKFISFLEAYYEFLEEKQGTEKNDLITKAKSIGNVSDVDLSLDDFEEQFYEKFASLLPKDVEVRKEILFKNLNRLYLSKGSIESYKFLFRLLFDEEVQIIEPKNEVLKPSSSVWSVENSLRVDPNELYLLHTGDGSKTTFLLPSASLSVRTVLVNGIQTNDYLINQRYKKLIFNSAPANTSTIKVYFNDFDYSLFLNRKVTGKTSRASAIVERFAVSLVSNRNIEDLYVNSKTLIGQFENGEYCTTDI
ncbi:MAG: Caulobacter phage Cr30, partial [Bacteroidota bacterium]